MKQKFQKLGLCFVVAILSLIMGNQVFAQGTANKGSQGLAKDGSKVTLMDNSKEAIAPTRLENGGFIVDNSGSVKLTVQDANSNVNTIIYSKPTINLSKTFDEDYTMFVSRYSKWAENNPNYKDYCSPEELKAIESGDFNNLYKIQYQYAVKMNELNNQNK